MAGWIKLHRDIQRHWIYTEKRKFSKFEAWTDILLSVNHAQAKTIIKGKLITIDRGESILSLDSWANKWGWNKSAVNRFFELLKKDGMILLKNETVTTRLTVCNYASYQDERNDNETQTKRKRNASETQTKSIEEEQEGKEQKEEQTIEYEFEQLWVNYKLGARKVAFERYSKLSESVRNKILIHLPQFAKNHRDAGKEEYLPHFSTYISKERWNDELPYKTKITEPTTQPTMKRFNIADYE